MTLITTSESQSYGHPITITTVTTDAGDRLTFTRRGPSSSCRILRVGDVYPVSGEERRDALLLPAIAMLAPQLPEWAAHCLTSLIADAEEKQAATARMAARLAEAETCGTPVFLRWGKAPKGGRSYNHREGTSEAGVSVYRGWRISETRYIVDWRTIDAVAAYTVAHDGRDVYLLTGEIVGRGGDGEPLLANVKQRRMHANAEIEVIA